MKWPLEKIIPIVICILFPVLNYVISHDLIPTDLDIMLVRWLAVSAMLYLLWHVLFYINTKSQQYRWLKIVIAGCIFVVIIYNLYLLSPLFKSRPVRWPFVYKSFLAVVPFTIIQYALLANRKVSRMKLEHEKMQTENYKVQLESLRSKVDPHFLFNSLNTLRGMVRAGHPSSEEFILSMADFYRQSLKYDEKTTLPVSEELKMLESFLFLMKSRNESSVRLEIDIPDHVKDEQLPTLSLQILVENCFKHNAMSSKNPLLISVYSYFGYIVVENNKNEKLDSEESAGYGLENLRRRYELLGISDGVITEDSDDIFKVRLKLIEAI